MLSVIVQKFNQYAEEKELDLTLNLEFFGKMNASVSLLFIMKRNNLN